MLTILGLVVTVVLTGAVAVGLAAACYQVARLVVLALTDE